MTDVVLPMCDITEEVGVQTALHSEQALTMK